MTCAVWRARTACELSSTVAPVWPRRQGRTGSRSRSKPQVEQRLEAAVVQDGGVRAFATAPTGDLVRRRARLESARRRCRHAGGKPVELDDRSSAGCAQHGAGP